MRPVLMIFKAEQKRSSNLERILTTLKNPQLRSPQKKSQNDIFIQSFPFRLTAALYDLLFNMIVSCITFTKLNYPYQSSAGMLTKKACSTLDTKMVHLLEFPRTFTFFELA